MRVMRLAGCSSRRTPLSRATGTQRRTPRIERGHFEQESLPAGGQQKRPMSPSNCPRDRPQFWVTVWRTSNRPSAPSAVRIEVPLRSPRLAARRRISPATASSRAIPRTPRLSRHRNGPETLSVTMPPSVGCPRPVVPARGHERPLDGGGRRARSVRVRTTRHILEFICCVREHRTPEARLPHAPRTSPTIPTISNLLERDSDSRYWPSGFGRQRAGCRGA